MSRFEIVDDAPQGRFEIVDDRPARTKASTMERAMALPAGANRAVFAGLAGLPVDTVANAVDLGKAGIGYLTSKVTGKAPPEWTEPMNRREVVGSSDWIASQINKGADVLGVRSPIDNPRPDDRASRVLYAGGQFAGSSVNPNPQAKIAPAQQLVNTGLGTAGGLLAGSVSEVNPDWAGPASMLPAVAAATAANALKLGTRGGEAGRRQMEQRITDLKNAGIEEPSVGLASGNKTIMGVENLASLTPGSAGLFEAAREKMIAGIQGKTNRLRDQVSPIYGAVEAGTGIQSDLKGPFKERVNATTRALNERVGEIVGADSVVPVPETLQRVGQLTALIKGAEATSAELINPRIARIAENLNADVRGVAPVVRGGGVSQNPTLRTAVEPVAAAPVPNASLWNAPPPSVPQTVANPSLWNAPATQVTPMSKREIAMVQPGNLPANATLWNTRKEQGIPFGALKELRTSIGEEAASNAIIGTPEQAQFKRLYGAMSDDMRQAVNAADRTQAGVQVGPLLPSQQPGAVALNRANSFYSKAMDRADDLNSLANRSTPEWAYSSVANSLNAGPTVYERLRGVISTPTRQKIVATIIDDMGKATPGQQNAEGSGWSTSTFLTNYNRLDPASRKALFVRIPGGEKMADQLADIAKAADMVNQASKVWSNPSGTGAALSNRATVSALTVGAFFQPLITAWTVGGLAATNQVSKRLLLNPKFVNWLAEAPKVDPNKMLVHMQRLANNANFSRDEQFKRDVADYLGAVPSPEEMLRAGSMGAGETAQ